MGQRLAAADLPHYDGYRSVDVVFRLFDSVPPNEQEGDDVLDRCLGSALMRDPHCARIVAEALLHGTASATSCRPGA